MSLPEPMMIQVLDAYIRHQASECYIVITWTDDDSGSWHIYSPPGLRVIYCHYLNRWWFGVLTHIYVTTPKSVILQLPEIKMIQVFLTHIYFTRPQIVILSLSEPMMIQAPDVCIRNQDSECYIVIIWTDDGSGPWRIFAQQHLIFRLVKASKH